MYKQTIWFTQPAKSMLFTVDEAYTFFVGDGVYFAVALADLNRTDHEFIRGRPSFHPFYFAP